MELYPADWFRIRVGAHMDSKIPHNGQIFFNDIFLIFEQAGNELIRYE